MSKRGVVYARISDSEGQGGEDKVSIPVQLEDSRKRAIRDGVEIIDQYVDNKRYRVGRRWVEPGGERADRPEFLRLIADGYAQKYELIYARTDDRLCRGVRPAVPFGDMLEQTRIQVILVSGNFDLRTFYLLAAVNKMELDRIRDRIRMGHEGRAKRGMHHGGNGAIGYNSVRDDSGKTVGYVIDEGWRMWFTTLAEYLLSGMSYIEIWRRLPLPPGSSRQLKYGHVTRIINSPWYRGFSVYNGVLSPGRHPKMWDAETCLRVELEIARRRREHPRGRWQSSPFRDFLFCGLCGGPMRRGGVSWIRGRSIPNYGCAHYLNRVASRNSGMEIPHVSNSMYEHKIVEALEDMFRSVTREELEAYYADDSFSVGPETAKGLTRLQGELAMLDNEIAGFSRSIESLVFQGARVVLEDQVKEKSRKAEALRAEIAGLNLITNEALESMDIDEALEILRAPGLFDGDLGEAIDIIRTALPAVYVMQGELRLTLDNLA